MRCRISEKLRSSYRKGLWSPEEDQKLRDYILQHGHGCWSSIPAKAGLQRNGKSCRLRWINYLRPGLKHGIFTTEEEDIVMSLHAKLGNKWSKIAMHLPGRTDNEIKNYWNSYLKKRIPSQDQTNQKANPKLKTGELQPQPRNEATVSDSIKALESPSFPRILFAEWLARDLHGCPKAPGLENQWEMNSKWKDSWPGETAEESFAGGFGEGGMFEGLQPMNQGLGLADLFAASEVGGECYMGCDGMY